MSKINMYRWCESIINNPKVQALPVMTHPGIEMNGNTIQQALTDGAVHAAAIISMNKKYPACASTAIMDLTLEAEAFGCPIRFNEDTMPDILGRIVSDKASVDALKVPTMADGRFPEYIKADRIVAETIKDKPVFGGAIGPFSLAGRLYDMSEMMMALYMEPETIQVLLDKCTEVVMAYCRSMKESGMQGVVLAEPAAGLISNDDCLQFVTPYVKKVVDALQDEDFIIILHNCGNTGHCTQSMVATGARALHFGNAIDIADALRDTPEDILVMGNLDPVRCFKDLTPEGMKAATLEILQKTSSAKNFVLSSGCDVPPQVPLANVDAFYEALAEFNKSR